ncbi:MAG: malic enzyme-like NAD(P)-binding protein [Kiritimatiellia bacterium]|jgi:malate dehydrogenase (oxaloacetate-decarboxylating)(NADP+)
MTEKERKILDYHRGGKVSLGMPRRLDTVDDLCLAYTPGVATAVKAIAADPPTAFDYTAKGGLVAVVSDGTAILGLGDLGPAASIPVMEGKSVLFKSFANVNAWPVVLDHCREGGASTGPTDPQRVIDAVLAIAPMYGGINLEDIAAPACFEIEDRLADLLDIPVFHDDQWGTAVIVLAGVTNYAALAGKSMASLKVVINGAGAAGSRIREMLLAGGVAKDVVMCDSKGVIYKGRPINQARHEKLAVETPLRTLDQAMAGADVFIGVSKGDCVKPEWVASMADHPAIFALANPDPEIQPAAVAEAMGGRPYVMATGRSDFPNQINNVLCFPFLFRGALDVRATKITRHMKLAAAAALAAAARRPAGAATRALYPGEALELGPDYIIPKPFDGDLYVDVSSAVAQAAVEDGVARLEGFDLDAYRARLAAEKPRA